MRPWLTRYARASAAAALALLCACLGGWLLSSTSELGAALARASYDSYFGWFDLADGPPRNAPVVIVYLDLESHLRERQNPAKPWPRAWHAQLLRRLKAAGAAGGGLRHRVRCARRGRGRGPGAG